MESLLNEIDDFQFDFDAMNLDPNAFPDPTQPDSNFEAFFNAVFELDTSFNGDGTVSAGFTTPESCTSPEADHLFVGMEPLEPEWTPIIPQVPTQPIHPVLPLLWRPCSPPSDRAPPMPLNQFQYPDPQIHSVSQPVPYFSLPPRSVPDQGSVSPLRSTRRPTKSPTNMTSAPARGIKRRRSIHLEDLYTSDQESTYYDSDSSLSSAPPSPSVSSPPCLTRHGAKMGRKHTLEQTKERQERNERRRAYYHHHKQNPTWKARVNALERTRYYKRRAGTLDLHADVAPAKTLGKAVPQTANLTSDESTATSEKPKPKWKGWVVLSDEEEEPSEQIDRTSQPNAKKRKLTKGIKNTKEFVQSREQAEDSDGEDDGEEYRMISMDQSHRRAADRDTWVRRSRRAKQPVSYAEEI